MNTRVWSVQVIAAFGCAGAVALAACGDVGDDAVEVVAPPEPVPVVVGERPANVPPRYLATPVGYLHPDCVVQALPGEDVSASGDLVRAGGVTRLVKPCAHSRFDRSGREILALERATSSFETPGTVVRPQLPAPMGWLAWFSQTVINITWQSANFRVPTAPIRQQGNVVFFFNGMTPNDGSEIIQPVLQWNQAWHFNRWSIAPWCVKSGNGIQGPVVDVNVGDTLSGYMYPLGANSWAVGFNRNGASATSMSFTTTKVMNTVVGGAMEAYNITSCEHLPSSGFEFFTSISLYRSGSPFTPTWSSLSIPSTNPNCNVAPFAGTTTGGMTWLYQ